MRIFSANDNSKTLLDKLSAIRNPSFRLVFDKSFFGHSQSNSYARSSFRIAHLNLLEEKPKLGARQLMERCSRKCGLQKKADAANISSSVFRPCFSSRKTISSKARGGLRNR